MCDKKKPVPRGGRSRKEIDMLKRHKAWFRWVFIDLHLHQPNCRWARLARRVL